MIVKLKLFVINRLQQVYLQNRRFLCVMVANVALMGAYKVFYKANKYD